MINKKTPLALAIRREFTNLYIAGVSYRPSVNIKKEGDKFFKALKSHDFQMPKKLNTLTTNFKRTGTYDKIAWVDRTDFKFSGKCNVVPFYKAEYQDRNPAGGKKEISDHLPLWAEFRINELTQQLEQLLNPPN